MCSTCTDIQAYKPKLTVNQRINGYDPTRTTQLRNRFVKDLNKRFKELKRVIWKSVVEEDGFGLMDKQPTVMMASAGRKAFAFTRSGEKVGSFMNWMHGQVESGMLEVRTAQQVGSSVDAAWTNMYVQDSYKRGVIRARYEMGKAGYTVPHIDETGGVNASMATPFHMDRVGLLYTRTFSDLKGITDDMEKNISRILSQGMIDGDNPRLLARKMYAAIDGSGVGTLELTDSLGRIIPARRRAELLARTEIIRAHHGAMIQEYRNWGTEGVHVKAELVSAQDDRVCEECQQLEGSGKVYTLDQAEGLIPVHPQCRCIALPVVADAAKTKESKEGKSKMTRPPKPKADPIPEMFRKGGEWAGDNVEFDPEFFAMVKKVGKRKPYYERLRRLPETIIHNDLKQGPWYDPKNHKIYLPKDSRYNASLRYRQQTIYHEYGHAVDWSVNIQSNESFKSVFSTYKNKLNFAEIQKELDYLRRAIQGGRSTHLLEKYGAKNFADLEEMWSATADTVKAMNLKYGSGHSTEYFLKWGMREAEFIAHAFENKYLGNLMFKEIMPELYDDMIKMLDTILK